MPPGSQKQSCYIGVTYLFATYDLVRRMKEEIESNLSIHVENNTINF